MIYPFRDNPDHGIRVIWYPVADETPVVPYPTVFTDRFWDTREGFVRVGVGSPNGYAWKRLRGARKCKISTVLQGGPDEWLNGTLYSKYLAGEYGPLRTCCGFENWEDDTVARGYGTCTMSEVPHSHDYPKPIGHAICKPFDLYGWTSEPDVLVASDCLAFDLVVAGGHGSCSSLETLGVIECDARAIIKPEGFAATSPTGYGSAMDMTSSTCNGYAFAEDVPTFPGIETGCCVPPVPHSLKCTISGTCSGGLAGQVCDLAYDPDEEMWTGSKDFGGLWPFQMLLRCNGSTWEYSIDCTATGPDFWQTFASVDCGPPITLTATTFIHEGCCTDPIPSLTLTVTPS